MDEQGAQPNDKPAESAATGNPDARPAPRPITLADVWSPEEEAGDRQARAAEYRMPEGVRHARPGAARAAGPHAHPAPPAWRAHDGASHGHRPPTGYHERHMRWYDLPGALALAALAFLSVFFTYTGFGHSWDEALYLKGAESAADWTARAATGDAGMLSADEIARHWGKRADGEDPLHPEVGPVPKLVMGLGITQLTAHGFDPMVASRLPVAVAFALTVALLYWVGVRAYGRVGGTAAALMYALMPRVFGHAHIAASETLLAFFTVLTLAAFLLQYGVPGWRSSRASRSAWRLPPRLRRSSCPCR